MEHPCLSNIKSIYCLMKKVIFFVSVLACMAFGMTSCNKEENVTKADFVAYIDNSAAGKAVLDMPDIKWELGDQIQVMGADGVNRTCVANEGGSVYTTFSYTTAPTTDVSGLFKAFYGDGCSVIGGLRYQNTTVPAVQESQHGEMHGMPMYAESETNELQFKNMCGAIEFTVGGDYGSHLVSIGLSSSSKLSGTLRNVTDGDYHILSAAGMSMDETGCKTLRLSIAEPTQNKYYIYLPVGTYNDMTITMTTDNNLVCTKTISQTFTIARNEVKPISINNPDFAAVEVEGHFSVSASKQVCFAPGNLQYVDGAWRFAEHQYDFLASSSGTAWDLFGWSTDEYYGMKTSSSNSAYAGDFNDWGNAVSTATEAWFTLSKDEWNYLRNSRANAREKIGIATIDVNGTVIKGVVVLPDGVWQGPGFTPGFHNGNSNDWGRFNQYTAQQWAAMESAGAVFLPVVSTTLSASSYWLQTPQGGANAYAFYIGTSGAGTDWGGRSGHKAVRLVREVSAD